MSGTINFYLSMRKKYKNTNIQKEEGRGSLPQLHCTTERYTTFECQYILTYFNKKTIRALKSCAIYISNIILRIFTQCDKYCPIRIIIYLKHRPVINIHL